MATEVVECVNASTTRMSHTKTSSWWVGYLGNYCFRSLIVDYDQQFDLSLTEIQIEIWRKIDEGGVWRKIDEGGV